MSRKNADKKKFAVVGLGLFGKSLALALAQAGREVLAIDKDPELVQSLANSALSVVVRLDATDGTALQEHGAADVDVAVVTMADDFEANIMAAYHLLKAGVPRVIARVATPLQRGIMEAMGVHEIIVPEEDAAHRLGRRLASQNVVDHIPLGPGFSIDSLEAPEYFVGRNLADINLRKKYEVTLIAVRKPSPEGGTARYVTVPGADYVVQQEDILVVVGTDAALKELTRK